MTVLRSTLPAKGESLVNATRLSSQAMIGKCNWREIKQMAVTHTTTLRVTSLCLCVIVCVCVCVVLFVWSLTRPLCGSPLSQILPIVSNWRFFVCVGKNSKDKFFPIFLLDQQPRQFVAISQAMHGNQPGDPWKSTPGPR